MKNTSYITWIIVILASSAAGFVFSTGFLFHANWIGFFYPDKNDLSVVRQSESFKTLNQCRIWADDMAASGSHPNSDYECGKSCKSNPGGPMICSETSR